MLGRHGAPIPRGGTGSTPAVVHQGEPLPLGILEIQHQAAVALGDLVGTDAERTEALGPPLERGSAAHAQVRARQAVRAAPLARHLPVEECQVRPRRPDGVGVEQVVRADVVLIDAALHQAHAQRLGVEAVVPADVGGNRREVMNAGEIHGRSLQWDWWNLAGRDQGSER